jgi:hypothetical protein
MSPATARRLALIATLSLCASAASAQGTPARFARVDAEDARVLNLADEKGIAIASPSKGTLVAVFDEVQSGWSAIEIPGGFPVWVYGAYLEESPTPGTFEVTRDAVNLRPKPSNDIQSFPLPQRLSAGTRLQAIERPEASVPSKEAWIHVWSPPGIRAWIRTSALAALAANEDGKTLWDAAVASAPRVTLPAQARADAAPKSETAEVDPALRQELETAREKLAAERVKEAPDYPVVRRALEALLVKSSTGPVAIEARNELRLLETLERAEVLEAELARERVRVAEKAREDQAALVARSRAKDPLGDAFAARGVLTREQGVDGKTRYWLSFGGKRVAEALCSSGRYALDLFAGYEIGVQGFEVEGSEPVEGRMRIELTRLEVIGRR